MKIAPVGVPMVALPLALLCKPQDYRVQRYECPTSHTHYRHGQISVLNTLVILRALRQSSHPSARATSLSFSSNTSKNLCCSAICKLDLQCLVLSQSDGLDA